MSAGTDEGLLIARHRDLAVSIARDYFIPGAGREDVIQEATIGLLVAARAFDGAGHFRSFAALVIRRWLQTEVTRARREKRRILSDAVRIARDPETGEEWPATDLVEDIGADIVDLLARREEFARFVVAARSLSELERRAMLALLNGEHPHAGGIDKPLDNAMMRARKKLRDAA